MEADHTFVSVFCYPSGRGVDRCGLNVERQNLAGRAYALREKHSVVTVSGCGIDHGISLADHLTQELPSEGRRPWWKLGRIRAIWHGAWRKLSFLAKNSNRFLKSDIAFRTGAGFSFSAMAFFKANSDYEEKDSDPLRLNPGDTIEAGPADRTWPGWIWAKDGSGRDGYVPEEILISLGDGKYEVHEAFDPAVLTIRRGDRLESLRQIHGWHWCRNEMGSEGWVAGYLLRPE